MHACIHRPAIKEALKCPAEILRVCARSIQAPAYEYSNLPALLIKTILCQYILERVIVAVDKIFLTISPLSRDEIIVIGLGVQAFLSAGSQAK